MSVFESAGRGTLSRRTWLVPLLAALVVAVALGSAGGASGQAKPPIVITAIDAYTIPAVGQKNEWYKGAQARASRINATGGINGRRVRLIVCDTQFDANRMLACARQAVADKSTAVIGLLSPGFGAAFQIVAQAGIPVVFDGTDEGTAATSRFSFGFTNQAINFAASVAVFRKAGVRKMGALIPEFPGVDAVEQVMRKEGARLGVEIGNIVRFPLTTTDFSAFAARAASGGVAGVYSFVPGPGAVAAAQAIRQAAPNARLQVSLGSVPASAYGPLADGLLASEFVTPKSYASKGRKLFRADFKGFETGTAADTFAPISWSAMWLIERVAKDLKTVNKKTLTAALSKLTNFDMGGLVPNYTTSKPGPFPGQPRLFNTSVVPVRSTAAGLVVVLDTKSPFVRVEG